MAAHIVKVGLHGFNHFAGHFKAVVALAARVKNAPASAHTHDGAVAVLGRVFIAFQTTLAEVVGGAAFLGIRFRPGVRVELFHAGTAGAGQPHLSP